MSHQHPVARNDFYFDIARGVYSTRTAMKVLGEDRAMNTSEELLWTGSSAYTFPAAAAGLEVVGNAADAGSVNFNGTASGGSTTTLVDATKDFTAGATAVVAGDVILLDSAMEIGIVTAVAATTLTVAAGFTNGASGNGATYRVLDVSASGTGVNVIQIDGLTSAYAEISEFVVMNGATEVATTLLTWFRVNGVRTVYAGSGNKAAGAINVRNLADTPVYGQIATGQTRSRAALYTVPAGKEFYITGWTASVGATAVSRTGTMMLKTDFCPAHSRIIKPASIFFPLDQVLLEEGSIDVQYQIPLVIPEKATVMVTGYSDAAAYGNATIKGWIEG